MPIHEYRCRECDRSFEYFRRAASDRADPRCPACGGTRVERKLSVFAAPQGVPKPCQAAPASPCSGCCDATGACGL